MMNFYRAPKIAAHARVIAAFAVAAATLGACASSTDLARSNPNYFSADISAGRLTGQYNPSGFSTAEGVSELAGRGVGMDVVRAEVNAMGGRMDAGSDGPGEARTAPRSSIDAWRRRWMNCRTTRSSITW